MPEMLLKGGREFDISKLAPPTALTIALKIEIQPPTGAVLVYSPAATDPVRFNGPEEQKEVPIKGPKVWYQLVQGTTDCQISCVGYRDNI
jgi:hypothetical protein